MTWSQSGATGPTTCAGARSIAATILPEEAPDETYAELHAFFMSGRGK